jgi:hypothetical protein
MNEANLLVDVESFHWTNLSIDRSMEMDKLILAMDKISENGDNIYNHPAWLNLQLHWGFFYEILNFGEEERLVFAPWLSRDYQITLVKLFNRAISQRPSYNLVDLNNEFPDDNNGLLGLNATVRNLYVSCDITWFELHANFVKNHYEIRETHFKHFKKFYQPELRIDANQINHNIDTGKMHPLFKRLDKPTHVMDKETLHGEKIQMHFNDKDKCALNIDGTWKHKSFDLPKDVKNQLIELGFILPDE